MNDSPSLGSCCVCERTDAVVNIILLPYRGPTPGKGWGCVQCDLPADGATAVVCNDCVDKPLTFICTGYPGSDGRTPIELYELEMFDHDMSKHDRE